MQNQQPDFIVSPWVRNTVVLCPPAALVIAIFAALLGASLPAQAFMAIAFASVCSLGVVFNRKTFWGAVAEAIKTWKQ